MLPKNNDVPSTVKCIPMAEMLKCGKIGLMESMKYVPASGAKIYRDMIENGPPCANIRSLWRAAGRQRGF